MRSLARCAAICHRTAAGTGAYGEARLQTLAANGLGVGAGGQADEREIKEGDEGPRGKRLGCGETAAFGGVGSYGET